MLKFILPLLLCFTAAQAAEKIVLTTANTVTLRGEVTEESVVQTQTAVADLVRTRGVAQYPIYLVLDTPGGSVDAGENLIQFLKVTPNISTISIFAASMGAAIVEGNPGERLVTENGMIMFHRAAGAWQGQFNEGEVESRLAMAKAMITALETRNAARLQMTLPDYKAAVKDELWIYGADNITKHAADRQVDIVCSPALLEKQDTILESLLFFSAKSTYSRCPLIRGPISTQSDGDSKFFRFK